MNVCLWQQLLDAIVAHVSFIDSEHELLALANVLGMAVEGASNIARQLPASTAVSGTRDQGVAASASSGLAGNEYDRHMYDREMIQEQEQEKEQQKQVQVQKDVRSNRSDEAPITWNLSQLEGPTHQLSTSLSLTANAAGTRDPFYMLNSVFFMSF